jgi:NADH-quinone oxidoreductase subunit E
VNDFQQKHAAEIEKILAKYPHDQKKSAVMPLLFLAQQQEGYIPQQSLQDIGEIVEIHPTEVASIVGFYTLYHDKPAGKYRIQVCTDLPCALRGAEAFLEQLCQNLGINVGETTPDGLVTVEAVMCLAACDKAPVFQVQTSDGIIYRELQSIETAMKLIETWKNNQPKP